MNHYLFHILIKASYLISEVEVNLHGLEGRENEHSLVNTGAVYSLQMGSFVMEAENFSRKFVVG
jgi:hypothetical protein